MPDIVIIAGPNGAGKTTFAREYFKADLRFQFVNADEIARKSLLEGFGSSDIQAARIMLQRIDRLVDGNFDFSLETTLASLAYARKIPIWRAHGYAVTLIYLRLNSVEEALERVKRRVAAGGHNIPEDAIRRRFSKSAFYLETLYKPLVTSWHIYHSLEGSFPKEASSESE